MLDQLDKIYDELIKLMFDQFDQFENEQSEYRELKIYIKTQNF